MSPRTEDRKFDNSRLAVCSPLDRVVPIVLCAATLVVWTRAASAEIPFEREPINYLTSTAHDPVAQLQERLQNKKVTLRHDDRQGYLKSVLESLNVPVSSQVLVFSKTSFQRTRIAPDTPRALYFNDDVYVGFVQGSDVLEFSAVDPQLGGTFYLLEQTQTPTPTFLRQTHDCLQCHASGKTLDVPGHLVRSVYPEASGEPAFNAGTFSTSHESPLAERWGGWYVTGTHGKQTHLGNVLVTDHEHPEKLNTKAGANLMDLSAKFDTSAYLTGGSDLVALMVLEHQVKMHNLITLANFQAKIAIHYARAINKALGDPEDTISETTARRFQGPAEDLVKYMLFVEEAPLSEPVHGTSSFEKDFPARGPRDRQGRSLRDFDLKSRLFRYPCSCLVYSKAFDALPGVVKDFVYRRLWEILSGKDQSEAYSRRTPEERKAILEILRETKKGLPDYWKAP
jgi:hypothetical protein